MRKIGERKNKQHPITQLPSSFSLTEFILKKEEKNTKYKKF